MTSTRSFSYGRHPRVQHQFEILFCFSDYILSIFFRVFFCLLVYVIAWARGQLKINFTSIFKVFTKLPESRSDEGNLENFENTSEINP